MTHFHFSQVNVFSAEPLSGNPVAVIHDAGTLSEEQMRALARWTNLSETTFLLPPEDPMRQRSCHPNGLRGDQRALPRRT